MKKLFQYLFSFLVCLQLVGGPSSLVQVYAWANMLALYSSESGIVQGTFDTFSGDKPCALCCKLTKIKAQEDTKKHPLSTLQIETKHLRELIASTPLGDLKTPFSTNFPAATFVAQLLPTGVSGCGPDAPPPRALA